MDGSTISDVTLASHFGSGGKIGPNSVTQLGETVIARLGREAAQALYSEARVPHLLDDPPQTMIDEAVPATLFAALWDLFPQNAAPIAEEAGYRTADYIIARRIPRLAQVLLRIAPRAQAARMLLKAIGQHAWTFAGSGQCDIQPGRRTHLISIRDNPLEMPDCVWHRAVLARLFERLVSPAAEVRHLICCGEGGAACQFEITLQKAQTRR
ncbi:MAG: bacteriochlorophyll 4-vinyl reductase [Pseudomonadota bacterium]